LVLERRSVQFSTSKVANATGLHALSAISAAVPVRLIKRDLLFVVERMASPLDDNRCDLLAKQHGIKKTKENESVGKLFAAFLRRADESTLGRAVWAQYTNCVIYCISRIESSTANLD
jgi:hypothetical protein